MTIPTNRTHPTGTDEEAKGTAVLLHANQTKRGSISQTYHHENRVAEYKDSMRTRKYTTEYKIKLNYS